MKDQFQETPKTLPRKTEVKDYMTIDGVTYMSRLTLCGKNCKGCPHGPYWFARTRRYGVEREIYIGKTFRTLAEFNAAKKLKRQREKKEEKEKRGMIKNAPGD